MFINISNILKLFCELEGHRNSVKNEPFGESPAQEAPDFEVPLYTFTLPSFGPVRL